MKFWDSSAIVPLLVEESQTTPLRKLVKADPQMVVWWSTFVECVSAVARQRRKGVVSIEDESRMVQRLDIARLSWTEVLPTDSLREMATRLLRVHDLRAVDALQLSAALQWVSGRPRMAEFVTRDNRLGVAAEREGFIVL